MNSSVTNSTPPFNHPTSGSSSQLSDTSRYCISHYFAFVFLFIERTINLVVGYPANLMVMWLVAREKSDSSSSDNFIFSLALADACLCLMSFIGLSGLELFRLIGFIFVLRFTTGIKNGSPLFLACICLDRYVAVVHPVVFTSIKDKKIRVAFTMLNWGLVIAYAVCRSLHMVSELQFFVGLILSAFIIMLYCNVSIIWSLRKSVLGKEKIHPMKKKALRTVQIYLGIIVFHYLPAAVVSVVGIYFPRICTIGEMIFRVMYLSSITQPLLYISLMNQPPWLKNLLCICCRRPSPEPHDVST